MKSFLKATALVIGLAALTQAAVKTPPDFRGNTVPVIDWVGATACVVGPAAGTTGKVCSTTPAIVYGYSTSLDAFSNFVVLWDSTTNVTGSSFTVITSTGNLTAMNATAGTANNMAGDFTTVKFPVPVHTSNGLVAVPNAAVANGAIWTIYYRPFSATE